MPLLWAITYPLALTNAALNGLATILLICGYILIRQRKEAAHKSVMLAAFGVSTIFLGFYLWHHTLHGSVPFGGTGSVRLLYYAILISHVILAAAVPFLAIWTIWLGLVNARVRHRFWAKLTFPIWLYVSITGVVVYLLNYVLFPSFSAG
ncbi:MAG: DUF420 domain-containing protein [Pirellulales bacterium]|nr:DUF420 domain-containing protein [Pirellulales bacterium]